MFNFLAKFFSNCTDAVVDTPVVANANVSRFAAFSDRPFSYAAPDYNAPVATATRPSRKVARNNDYGIFSLRFGSFHNRVSNPTTLF